MVEDGYMHRAQIMIEPWHHDALRALAESRGVSVSAIVRDILTEHLSTAPGTVKKRLDEIAGVAEGPADLGSEHDSYLYGKPKTRPGDLDR